MHGVQCDVMLSAPIYTVDNVNVNSGGDLDIMTSDVINSLLLLLMMMMMMMMPLRASSVLLSDTRIDWNDNVQSDEKQRCSCWPLCIYTVFQKSDAKIQITITTAYLIRIKYPLSGFNYHLTVS